jgi:hypothetical protein
MPRQTPTKPSLAYRCSFCGRTHDQIKHLITGPGRLYICDGCVGICNEILALRRNRAGRQPQKKRPKAPRVKPSQRKPLDPASQAGVDLVREQYEDIVHLGKLDLTKINRGLHPAEHYCSMREYVRELWARAGAVASFAVSAGLISGDQALQIIKDFLADHPDVPTVGPPK